MKSIYQAENFTISLDESIPSIVSKAIGHPKSSEQLQEAFKQVLKSCEQYVSLSPGLTLVLDLSEASGATSEDSEWVMNYLNPRLERAGIRKMAIISPKEEFARMSVTEFLELPPSGQMNQRLFGEMETAQAWLTTK